MSASNIDEGVALAGQPLSAIPANLTANASAASKATAEALRPIPARTVWFMAISTGLVVANIYYAQPLLAEIARAFHLGVTQAGALAMTSQIGTALGMLLFVPQGDTRERRSFIIALLLASTISLLLFAAAPNAIWLTLASLAVGATASIVHVVVPFAAHLAPAPRNRHTSTPARALSDPSDLAALIHG